jgi:hypothetical protein
MPLLIHIWPNWRFIPSKGKGAKQACGKITAEGLRLVQCEVLEALAG